VRGEKQGVQEGEFRIKNTEFRSSVNLAGWRSGMKIANKEHFME
jgi:hypothetical protein